MNQKLLEEIQKFEDHLTLEKYSDRTTKNYSAIIKKYLQATSQDSQEELDKYLGRKKINHQVTRSALKKYFQHKGIHLKIPKPKKSRKQKDLRDKTITLEEAKTLVNNILKVREQTGNPLYEKYALGIRVMFETGLRIGELLRLTPKNLDTINNKLRGIGKGGVKYELPLSNNLMDWLIEYSASLEPNTFIFRSHSTRKALPNPEKDLQQDDVARNVWARFVRHYGKVILGKDISPHILRHACITHLVKKGIPLEEAKEYARHADISSTMIYIHTINRQELYKKVRNIFN